MDCDFDDSKLTIDRQTLAVRYAITKYASISITDRSPALSAPVDIYADWIDACDDVAKEAEQNQSQHVADYQTQSLRSTAPSIQKSVPKDDRYEEDFVVNDEGGMEEDYAPA